MQKHSKYLYFFFLAFICTMNLHAQKLNHVQGEVLVEVRNDSGLNYLLQDLSKDAIVRSSLVAKQVMTEPMNLWVVKVNPNEINEIQFLNNVTRNNHVLLAQKNHIAQLRVSPNDFLFQSQWQYINTGQSGGMIGADLDMDLAWDMATGGLTTDGDEIVVCIIDDGINPNHPDLGDNLWINQQEIADNGIDDDENGYIDDIKGWNAYTDSDDVYSGGGHGTPVAGVIGAQGNNEIGVAGVNWDVKLMIVRGGSPESTALASYAYPYTMRKMYNETNGEKGAFVVSTNASWGVDFGNPEDAPIWCDFYNKLGEVGILSFGATINGNTNVDVAGDLPTACESNYLVAVTNMNRQNEKVSGAGYGERSIDLGAFGSQTYTLSSSAYGGFGGTSAATPHVAGTAALLYSADCPDFISLVKSDPAQAALVIKDCILHGIVPNESLLGITTTGGRLNAYNAIQNLVSTCGDCSSAFGGEIDELSDKKGILTWFDNGNVGTTSIRYKMLSAIDWIEIENVASGFEFTNLTACSSYEFQTKTICSSNPDAAYTYSRVFETDGCCETPRGVNIDIVDQMATIHWDDVLAANNFVVEWKNINDTDWSIVNIGEDNTFILDGIIECEFYQVRIKSQCEVTSNESEFTEIFEINGECGGCTREFCSFSSKNISDEWIESVEIENIFSNISGEDPNGYGSFLGQFDINLTKEETYNINLTPGYSGSSFNEYFSAYIDFNQNGMFEENEIIYRSDQSTEEPVSGPFTIPNDAVAGTSRMRIIMRFNALNGPCDDSGFEYGEIEEYCVNILDGNECPSSLFATVSDTMLTSLTYEFPENMLVDTYMILIRVKDSIDFDTITSSSNEILVSDLTICTMYEYKSGHSCQNTTVIDENINDAMTLCEVATDDESDNLSLSIFPNPSFGNLIIDFGDSAKFGGVLTLITSEGKAIITDRPYHSGASQIIIDAHDIPSGVYFLKATSKDQFVIKKWVKY